MAYYVMGLDNGGTLSKAALFDLQGHEIAVVSRQTPLITLRPGYTERDMEDLWRLNCECIGQVLQKAKIPAVSILGVAILIHGKGLYTWGKDGKPAYNGIASTDSRAWEYPENWKRNGVFQEIYPKLCQQLIPCQQVSLLAWMKDHARGSYDNIKWVFSVKDYIRFRLTGEAHSEITDISGSGLMNVRDKRIDRDLLERLGVGEIFDKIPPLCSSCDLCGVVTKEVARLTGLAEGTPVAGGMFDIDACAIAMDIHSPEQLCTISGTWSINEFISKTPIVGTEVAMNSLFAIPDYYLLEECSATSAGNLEWFLKNCMENMTPPEGKRLYDYVDELVDSVDPAACDVYYLPFLYGSNAHPLARATFIGLTSYHTRAHMLRAIYEGVVFSHKTHIDRLLSVRRPPEAIRLAGGAANSPLWVQMFADILNYPIETVRGVKELGALGCGMAAAIAAGIYKNYAEAAESMVRVNEQPVIPVPQRSAVYAEKYEKYKAVRDALNPIWQLFSV